MTLEERLEAMARYHEDAAQSVRTTLALLMNGARDTAAKSMSTKLKSAIALRHAHNGNGNGNGHGATPEGQETGLSQRSPGLRPGSERRNIIAWLAKVGEPQTLASIARRFPHATLSTAPLVRRGILQIANPTRPYTYTVSDLGREALAQTGATPRTPTTKAKKKTPHRRAVKGALLLQLREVMQDVKGKVSWPELQALAVKKGITTLNRQTVGAASRHGHLKVAGSGHKRRYTWVGV